MIELNSIIKDKELSFLVGAGISMDKPSSVPSAREIVRSLLELCVPPEEVENLLGLDNLRFEFPITKEYRNHKY